MAKRTESEIDAIKDAIYHNVENNELLMLLRVNQTGGRVLPAGSFTERAVTQLVRRTTGVHPTSLTLIIIIIFIQLSYICCVSFYACYTDAKFAILSVQQLKRNHPGTYWSVYCVVGKPVYYALSLVICHMFFQMLVLVLILIKSFHFFGQF